ncbi:MAG: glycerophosphodiester phosphodiesterase family protein [Microbacteriaceae bacterium]
MSRPLAVGPGHGLAGRAVSGPLIVGHRGASGHRPEHSRAAYELAIAMGADAVEPDVVASRDGVLVVRHENEISGTTDVASRPEFAGRRRSQRVDGRRVTGWFTEDFDWAELATLRVRERLPALRRASAAHDGRQPMLRLEEVLQLAAEGGVGVVAELKHHTHFRGIGLDLAELAAPRLAAFPGPLCVESFEASALAAVRERGLAATLVYLVEARGTAADLRARDAAPSYAEQLTDAGLARLAATVEGVSVPKSLLVGGPLRGVPRDPRLVERAHRAGLAVLAWTLRPENAFLARGHRRPGGLARHGDWRGEWSAVVRTGVDGVFVDHPDLARELLAGPVEA